RAIALPAAGSRPTRGAVSKPTRGRGRTGRGRVRGPRERRGGRRSRERSRGGPCSSGETSLPLSASDTIESDQDGRGEEAQRRHPRASGEAGRPVPDLDGRTSLGDRDREKEPVRAQDRG